MSIDPRFSQRDPERPPVTEIAFLVVVIVWLLAIVFSDEPAPSNRRFSD
ncbi:hypothetical protein [Methylobacterium iners]|nr:hypothetical protein [Methylobacterium iners]